MLTGQPELVLLNLMSRHHGAQHSPGGNRGVLRLLNLGKQDDDEFVATLATDGIRAANALDQTARNRL